MKFLMSLVFSLTKRLREKVVINILLLKNLSPAPIVAEVMKELAIE